MNKKYFWFRLFLMGGVIGISLADGSKGAHAEERLAQDSMRVYHNQDARRLSPSERVKVNALKAEADPTLRGKWDSKAWRPASASSLQIDNLPQVILSRLREDKDLADSPMKIKVSSQKGVVVLEGVVNNESERSLVARKVSRIEGVQKVKNYLKIKSSDKDLQDD